MSGETLIRARREMWSESVSLHLAVRTPFGFSVAQPLSLTEEPEGSYAAPFLKLSHEEAQRLMDELWDCGLRPSEGSGSAGSLRATEKHLEDMQRIAFMLLERAQSQEEPPT